MGVESLPDGAKIADLISDAIRNGESNPQREEVELNLLLGFWESGQHPKTPAGFVSFVKWFRDQDWDDEFGREAAKATTESLNDRAQQQSKSWGLEFRVHPKDEKAAREVSLWSMICEVTGPAVRLDAEERAYRNRWAA